MINTGMTTKSWSDSEQVSGLKPAKGNRVGANEKPFGDKGIGEALNEIADPNWVDPKKVQREAKQDLDKEAFFKLMLTQMKNQDPFNPIQSHEMAAQLAQFTSVEQLFNVNKNLEGMRTDQAPTTDYQALQFIGKHIEADSSVFMRNKGDDLHTLRFNLGGPAEEIHVSIFNEAGEKVRTLKFNNLKDGKNDVSWNGYNDQGQKLTDGEFHFSVEAKGATGKKVTADTKASGEITGVQFTRKGPMFYIGNQTVYLKDVNKIVQPKAAQEAIPGAPVAQGPVPTAESIDAKYMKPLNNSSNYQSKLIKK